MHTTRCPRLAIFVVALLAGCSLVVDFDRSRLPDAGVEDAGQGGSGGGGGQGGRGGSAGTGRAG